MFQYHITPDSSALDLIHALCQVLAQEKINYCHWKSNEALDRSASGDNDLDLLICRADAQRFTEILFRLGFKEAVWRPDKHLPGVLHYYGYDTGTGRFVHVHAHYQLILGDDTTKNYRLPIEDLYLASATQNELFRVPAPELELTVFVIRMMLKHATPVVILTRRSSLSASEQRELVWLRARVDQPRVHCILGRYLPFISTNTFDRCLQSLADESHWCRYQAGRQLHRELRSHARRAQVSDVCLKLWRRGTWGIRRHLLRKPNRKRLTYGGAIIAIVGGDGSGKSTAVEEVYAWLAKNFTATKVHFGKPPWSLGALLAKGLLKVGKWFEAILERRSRGKDGVTGSLSYLTLLRYVLTARDRYRLYCKVRRFATNGGLVVCDRYPVPQITLMDSARVRSLADAQRNRFVRLLIDIEERYYRPIMPPDLLAVMRIAPEIAAQRLAYDHMPESSVKARCQEIWDLDWKQISADVIDAGLSKAEVSRRLKTLVWSRL